MTPQQHTPEELERELGRLLPGGHWQVLPTENAPDGVVAAQFTEGESGRLVLTGLVLLADRITAEQLRAIPVTQLERNANLARRDVHEQLDRLPPLKRTPGMDPEEFSRLVAEHYRVWVRAVPNPVAAMAKRSGVKLATMHTWVREARLRGFLPPGRQRATRAPRGSS